MPRGGQRGRLAASRRACSASPPRRARALPFRAAIWAQFGQVCPIFGGCSTADDAQAAGETAEPEHPTVNASIGFSLALRLRDGDQIGLGDPGGSLPARDAL